MSKGVSIAVEGGTELAETYFGGVAKAEARAAGQAAGAPVAQAAGAAGATVRRPGETLSDVYRRKLAAGQLDEVVVDVDALSDAQAAAVATKVANVVGEAAPEASKSKLALKQVIASIQEKFRAVGGSAKERWTALTPRQRAVYAALLGGVAAAGGGAALYALNEGEAAMQAVSDEAAEQGDVRGLTAAERLLKLFQTFKSEVDQNMEDLTVDESLFDDNQVGTVGGNSVEDFDRMLAAVTAVSEDLKALRSRCGIDNASFELLRRLLLVDPDLLARAAVLNRQP